MKPCSLLLCSALFLPAHAEAHPTNHAPKIVLITIDGVRWQEVFYGTDSHFYDAAQQSARDILPNTYHTFVDQGMVIGRDSEMDVSGPVYQSMPGYLEILRGHKTTDCFSNDCHPNTTGTILDLVSQQENTTNIGVISSWNAIGRLVPSRFVVNAGRHVRNNWHYPEVDFPDLFVEADRPDQYTEQASIQYYANEHPDFLWVSLGDTDEQAHRGNYAGYIDSLRGFDRYLGELMTVVSKDTVVVLTTDHGRSKTFCHHGFDSDSKRTWMMIAGAGIPSLGFVDLKRTITASSVYGVIQFEVLKSKLQ